MDEQKILAIIPARGGSKTLPRKNILPLGGKPLIAWTIEAALASRFIDRVILSSDDNEICEIAASYGCEVPFIRPADIASDTATSVEVVEHALDTLEEEFDYVVLLQVTSPFRTEKHIDAALELLSANNAESVVSVMEAEKSPEWMYWLEPASMQISPVLAASVASRRQECRQAYLLNGAIYAIATGLFRAIRAFVSADTIAYPMNKIESLDIDTLEDLQQAERIVRNNGAQ